MDGLHDYYKSEIVRLNNENADMLMIIKVLLGLLGGRASFKLGLPDYNKYTTSTLIRYYDNETMSDVFELKPNE